MSETDRNSKLGLYLPLTMVVALAIAILLERHAAHVNADRLSETIAGSLREIAQQQEAFGSRMSNISSLQSSQGTLLRRLEARLRELGAAKESSGTTIAANAPEAASEEQVGVSLIEDERDHLPPLPEGFEPDAILVEEGLADLVTTYRASPERRLDHVETAKALNIMTETRARVDILRSRMQIAMLEGAKTLKARGEFFEYAPGEVYHSEPGLLSFGEDMGEHGMRMFYLAPEEFPELYAMKDEKEDLPQLNARRLLALINNPKER